MFEITIRDFVEIALLVIVVNPEQQVGRSRHFVFLDKVDPVGCILLPVEDLFSRTPSRLRRRSPCVERDNQTYYSGDIWFQDGCYGNNGSTSEQSHRVELIDQEKRPRPRIRQCLTKVTEWLVYYNNNKDGEDEWVVKDLMDFGEPGRENKNISYGTYPKTTIRSGSGVM